MCITKETHRDSSSTYCARQEVFKPCAEPPWQRSVKGGALPAGLEQQPHPALAGSAAPFGWDPPARRPSSVSSPRRRPRTDTSCSVLLRRCSRLRLLLPPDSLRAHPNAGALSAPLSCELIALKNKGDLLCLGPIFATFATITSRPLSRRSCHRIEGSSVCLTATCMRPLKEGRKCYICSSRLGLIRWDIIQHVKAVHHKVSNSGVIELIGLLDPAITAPTGCISNVGSNWKHEMRLKP